MAKKRDLNEIDIVSSELERLKKQTAQLDEGELYKEKQKKTIIALCVSFAVLLIAVVIGIFVYAESVSQVSYGPKASAAEQTEEMTQKHESRLEVMDKNGASHEGVNYMGYYARFNDEGDLVVDGYFRNFTGHEIYDITGNITIETVNGDNIGGAYFEFLEDDFGTLKNNKSRPWRLIFDNDYVNIEITDLSKFTVTTELEYFYK